MRINRISRLYDCGIFRDFAWPANLPDFGRYNLIYGWNWTGKTTLSRIMRCLEKRTAPAGQVTVVLDGRTVYDHQFPGVTLPVRVFNREFIAENVFPVGGGDLPPILVLGAESVEKQKEVERLKGDRTTAQSELDSARATRQRAERDFDQFCKDRALVIKDTLRSSGQNPYNNYDKSDFRGDAQELAAARDYAAQRLSDMEREIVLTQHRTAPKPKVQEVLYLLPDFEAIISSLSQLLTTTVVSAAIEVLKDDPALAEWTEQGLGLHRDRRAERCLFCDQPLPKGRFAALEEHFSAQYEQFVQRLDRFIGELQATSKAASELRLPNKAELYDDLAADFKAAESAAKKALDATTVFLDAAVQALMTKKRQAFKHVKLDLEAPPVEPESVDKLNAVIRKHNQACDDFQIRINAARERLAVDMIVEVLADFVRLRDGAQSARVDLDSAEQEIRRLDSEIARLEREIVEHRQPAEELNVDLHKYLGHDELSLDIKDSGYVIKRNVVPALALSEGEMTAIALLYFLKSLKDRRFDSAKGIVVLDDPVSSLDANALYLAFGFIRERTKDVGQLFIFTHNFTLFRQVKNWFHHLKGKARKDKRFYMLDCACQGGQRSSTIVRLDPLLERYESEYHYLFARIYREANADSATTIEESYVLPNMARRVLEAFLAFRRPQVSAELWQKMDGLNFDEAKKLRILRFVNTYSHGDAIGEPEHDPSLLAEAQSVLWDILEFIKSQDPQHFAFMEELSKQPAPEGDDA